FSDGFCAEFLYHLVPFSILCAALRFCHSAFLLFFKSEHHGTVAVAIKRLDGGNNVWHRLNKRNRCYATAFIEALSHGDFSSENVFHICSCPASHYSGWN